jgi:molybdopterin/thiamine biosynthesis adenylyltransferase
MFFCPKAENTKSYTWYILKPMSEENGPTTFDYTEAFCRNIGLLTEEEQKQLRTFTIAIPGMGGVGGAHLVSLVRQGFEKFKIADLDTFELKNMNRQYGACMDTLAQPKAEVMNKQVLGINPHCHVDVFDAGITTENIATFLNGVDLCVDALDAFTIDERRMFFMEAWKRKIPVITAAPIGFGTAFLIFMPEGPSFDAYFAIHDSLSYEEKLIAFFAGLAPKLLQRSYMSRVSLSEKRGPSSVGAVNLCAGVVAITAVKILLKKGKVRAVPYYHQYDVMQDQYVTGKLWFGNNGPLQRLKIKIAKHLIRD